jgi:hypothetical protein
MGRVTRQVRGNESGQAIAEYVLLLALTVIAFGILLNAVNQIGIMGLIMKPIQDPFMRAYQFGHPKANAPDMGGDTTKHPRLGQRAFYVTQ